MAGVGPAARRAHVLFNLVQLQQTVQGQECDRWQFALLLVDFPADVTYYTNETNHSPS